MAAKDHTGHTRIKNPDPEDFFWLFQYADWMNRCEAQILAEYSAKIDINTSEFKSQFSEDYGIGHRRFSSCRARVLGLIRASTTFQTKNLASWKEKIKKLNFKIWGADKLPIRKIFHQEKLASREESLQKLLQETPKTPKKLESWNKKIAALKEKIAKEQETIKEITEKLSQTQQYYKWTHRRSRLQQRVTNLEQDIAKGRVRIALGTKKLFKKQHHLLENGFADHQDWLDQWQFKRSCNFSLNGSKDQRAGNQLCQADLQANGLYQLTITLPPCLNLEHPIIFKDVDFSHGTNKDPGNLILQRALEHTQTRIQTESQERSQAKEEKRELNKEIYTSLGQAINFRFIFDKKIKKGETVSGLRVFFTTDVSPETWKEIEARKQARFLGPQPQQPPQRLELKDSNFIGPRLQRSYNPLIDGWIGYDLNHGFLSLVQLDRYGNKVDKKKITFPVYGLSANQRENNINEAAKTASLWIQSKGIYLAVKEILNLEKKKEEPMSPRRARALNSFPYAQVDAAIQRRFYKDGITLEGVDPAFTSFIGKLKFENMYGISGHEAAAMVIGRRKYEFSEALPEFSEMSWLSSGPASEGTSLINTYVFPARIIHKHGRERWKEVYRGVQAAVAPQFLAKVAFRPLGTGVHRKMHIPPPVVRGACSFLEDSQTLERNHLHRCDGGSDASTKVDDVAHVE